MRSVNDRLRIIVAGLAGSFPMAGTALHWIQYVLGFQALGHDVHYLEDAGEWFYDPAKVQAVNDISVPLMHLERLMSFFGLSQNWTFIDQQRKQYGVGGIHLDEVLRSADLLVHVTGAMSLNYDERYLRIPIRAYVDTDPGFIQARVADGSAADRLHLDAHTTHFTFGCNIGNPNCGIPSTGHVWHPTVQPIFLPIWSEGRFPRASAPFTTIVKWEAKGHGPMLFHGRILGTKDIEFRKFLRLPLLTGRAFEIAMAGNPPVENLEQFGWRRRSGPEISSTIRKYQEYILDSAGEWSMAKHTYVTLRTGWFSERSAGYLASGRPVVLQSTGFEDWLPCGEGVLPFQNLAEAVEAIGLVDSAPGIHRSAAKDIATSYFDSSKVLSRMVDISFAKHRSTSEQQRTFSIN